MATEKRLIDANALKDKFLYLRKMWSETEIVLTINDAKTVDAVEVVRCKDCRYLHQDSNGLWCFNNYENNLQPDDFCSYGERCNNE